MVPYEWFAPFKSMCTNAEKIDSIGSFERSTDYQEYKKRWEERCMDIFYKYFPKVELILFCDWYDYKLLDASGIGYWDSLKVIPNRYSM